MSLFGPFQSFQLKNNWKIDFKIRKSHPLIFRSPLLVIGYVLFVCFFKKYQVYNTFNIKKQVKRVERIITEVKISTKKPCDFLGQKRKKKEGRKIDQQQIDSPILTHVLHKLLKNVLHKLLKKYRRFAFHTRMI